MGKDTKIVGYFLVRFRDECLKFLKTRSAGDYETTLNKVVAIINEGVDQVHSEEEKRKSIK